MHHALLSVLLPLCFLAAIFVAMSALGAITSRRESGASTAPSVGLRERLRRMLPSRHHAPPSAPAT